MSGRVIVIASGQTERRSLPRLAAKLTDLGGVIQDVRIPPGDRPLKPDMVRKLIQTICAVPPLPDKIVVVLDTDGHDPDEVTRPVRAFCSSGFPVPILVAYAQRHLEAWFFADAPNLRRYLKDKSLGSVAGAPDAMVNPKLHLKGLLAPAPYTAFTAAEIADRLDPVVMVSRSPSFQNFVAALRNGVTAPE